MHWNLTSTHTWFEIKINLILPVFTGYKAAWKVHELSDCESKHFMYWTAAFLKKISGRVYWHIRLTRTCIMGKFVNKSEVIMLTELACQLYWSRSAETTDFSTFTLVRLRAKFDLGSEGGIQLKKNNEISHLGKQINGQLRLILSIYCL